MAKFLTMIIFKIWIFKISDIDQGIHKKAIEKNGSFYGFWKKLLNEKENFSKLVYSGLSYAHKN